jgi:hypothetical protein
VHVHPHEARPRGGRHRQRGPHVVLQDVHAHRERDLPPDLGDGDRHARDRRRVHPARGEGDVTVVLHHQRVDAPFGEGARVVERGPYHRGDVPAPPGAAGERGQVHHPDHGTEDVWRQSEDGGERHVAK